MGKKAHAMYPPASLSKQFGLKLTEKETRPSSMLQEDIVPATELFSIKNGPIARVAMKRKSSDANYLAVYKKMVKKAIKGSKKETGGKKKARLFMKTSLTSATVASAKKKFQASERRFKATRASLAKAKVDANKRITKYQATKIAFAMKTIADKFKYHTYVVAGQVMQSTTFSDMTTITSRARRYMAHSAVSMKASLKATADAAKKTTVGAFASKKVFQMLQGIAEKINHSGGKKHQQKAHSPSVVKAKYHHYLSAEKKSKQAKKAHLASQRAAHQQRLDLAGAVIASQIAASGKAFSKNVTLNIYGVMKASKLSDMRTISTRIVKTMLNLAQQFSAKVKAAVGTTLAAAHKTVAKRRKHTKKSTKPMPDANINSWVAHRHQKVIKKIKHKKKIGKESKKLKKKSGTKKASKGGATKAF